MWCMINMSRCSSDGLKRKNFYIKTPKEFTLIGCVPFSPYFGRFNKVWGFNKVISLIEGSISWGYQPCWDFQPYWGFWKGWHQKVFKEPKPYCFIIKLKESSMKCNTTQKKKKLASHFYVHQHAIYMCRASTEATSMQISMPQAI